VRASAWRTRAESSPGLAWAFWRAGTMTAGAPHVAQAVALLRLGLSPGPRRRQDDSRPLRRRRGGAGGTTFPASARSVGIMTSCPSKVRTAKEWAPCSSRMPRTSAICSPSSGPGPTPADHDPLTDIGRCEPDLEPVAQAGHPFRGAAPCAAVGLATAPSPAGDVAGDMVGVIGQRAGLGSAAGRSELVEEPDVLGGELRPLFGHVVFIEDRLDRAYRLAGAAVDALVGGGCRASARLRRCSRPGIRRRRSCPRRRCTAR
jgi:hypothetical protein